ncbi:MAG: methyltransferase domain-containing protein [Parachlamydia sp.]|jgi:2-polyprenyl-3-methyl-5-hydroxy-6-metoxy-1,4-benzoquinol methylase|nr:methyltransferase domain-containing protein [Parachlamydia sp.]
MQRINRPEWIDTGNYTLKQYNDCLYQLDRIGRLLGGDKATYWALKQVKEPIDSILDVGCGGGLFTLRLGKHYPQAQIDGIDISTDAIRFAQNAWQKNPLPNVAFKQQAQIDRSYDIILSTLVCHHLTNEELVAFIKDTVKAAKKRVIINDLHRHPLAWTGFAALAPLFFPNRLIWHDGLLSIRRSFTKKEWLSLLQLAGIPLQRISITWHWPFRWIVTIDTHG